MTKPAVRPQAIALDRSKELRITWSDGVVSLYPLAELRRACPCAGCRQQREETSRSALPVAAEPGMQRDMATAETVELVGHYALRIRWKDGHDTGIYDFARLRSLGTENQEAQ